MIRAYCTDDLTVLRWQGEDQWGEPLDYAEIDVKGYVKWKTRLVRNIAGEQVVSRGMAYLVYDENLTHKDFLKIKGIRYAIIDCREGKDFSVNHLEVHLA